MRRWGFTANKWNTKQVTRGEDTETLTNSWPPVPPPAGCEQRRVRGCEEEEEEEEGGGVDSLCLAHIY